MLQSQQLTVNKPIKVDPFDPSKRIERQNIRFLSVVRQNDEKTKREAPYVALGQLLRKEYIFVAQQIAHSPKGKKHFSFDGYTAILRWAPVDAKGAAARANSTDVAEFQNKTVCFVTVLGLKFIHPATIRAMDPFSEVLEHHKFHGRVEESGITFFASNFNEVWSAVANLPLDIEAPTDVIDVEKLNKVFAEQGRKARREQSVREPRKNLLGEVSASATSVEDWWAEQDRKEREGK